jgi:CDP-diacylglycerol pyrophosphatase
LCLTAATILPLFVSPARADGDPLWMLVSLKCMRHLAKSEAPIPCDAIDTSLGWDRGVALLKDGVGRARMLAIPTHPVSGIEDPVLLGEGEPNYFAIAWSEQYAFRARLGSAPPSSAVAVVVDSKEAREHEQLHLIVDCMEPEVAAALNNQAPANGAEWRKLPQPIKGRLYWSRRVDATRAEDIRPFQLLADGLPGAKETIASWSLALTQPASLKGKAFLLLADRAEGESGGKARDLLDSSCEVAGAR